MTEGVNNPHHGLAINNDVLAKVKPVEVNYDVLCTNKVAKKVDDFLSTMDMDKHELVTITIAGARKDGQVDILTCNGDPDNCRVTTATIKTDNVDRAVAVVETISEEGLFVNEYANGLVIGTGDSTTPTKLITSFMYNLHEVDADQFQ